jgi:hypothetical protein
MKCESGRLFSFCGCSLALAETNSKKRSMSSEERWSNLFNTLNQVNSRNLYAYDNFIFIFIQYEETFYIWRKLLICSYLFFFCM